jgi:hypothetical protein
LDGDFKKLHIVQEAEGRQGADGFERRVCHGVDRAREFASPDAEEVGQLFARFAARRIEGLEATGARCLFVEEVAGGGGDAVLGGRREKGSGICR